MPAIRAILSCPRMMRLRCRVTKPSHWPRLHDPRRTGRQTWAGNGGAFATSQCVLSRLKVGIGWRELVRRTISETLEDDGLGVAAQMAYYFFFALFPALLFLIALAASIGTESLIDRVIPRLEGTLPPDVVGIIRDQLTQIAQSGTGGILTFGALVALWSSSAALVAIIGATNRAYDVTAARPRRKQ